MNVNEECLLRFLNNPQRLNECIATIQNTISENDYSSPYEETKLAHLVAVTA